MTTKITKQDAYQRAVEKSTRFLSYAMLTAFAVTFLLPLYWMFTGSFKLQSVTMAVPPEFFPAHPTLENWTRLFTGPWPVWRWVLNSVAVSLLTVFLVLIVSSLTGYGFGKKKFPGSNVLFFILLSTMFLPNQVMLIPLFLLVRYLHLTSTILGTSALFAGALSAFDLDHPRHLLCDGNADDFLPLRHLPHQTILFQHSR